MTASGPRRVANTLTYDAENLAAAATTYVYEGDGLRVRKCAPNCTSPTSSTVYIFSGTKVIAEYSGASAPYPLAREYIYSGSALVATIEGSATKYHHPDHLSMRVTTDSSGVKIADSGHYPYGESWYETGTANKWKFTTYERDSESGNDYAMMRSYVNRLARFSSPDPLGGSISDPQSLNRYGYTVNDPANLIDPMGLVYRYKVADDAAYGWWMSMAMSATEWYWVTTGWHWYETTYPGPLNGEPLIELEGYWASSTLPGWWGGGGPGGDPGGGQGRGGGQGSGEKKKQSPAVQRQIDDALKSFEDCVRQGLGIKAQAKEVLKDALKNLFGADKKKVNPQKIFDEARSASAKKRFNVVADCTKKNPLAALSPEGPPSPEAFPPDTVIPD